MGAAVSKSNDELVDYLVNEQYLTCNRSERAFRLVDRGNFVPPETERAEAYRDTPLIVKRGKAPGKVHLSAPNMYATVIKKLNLREGLSFLNVGSGTGYLNSIVGFLLGVNHGIEIFPDIAHFSYECLERTLRSGGVAAFPWAPPVFATGNGLNLPDLAPHQRYDRIYCGASVNSTDLNRVLKLVKVGGIVVIPEETPTGDNRLMVYERVAEDRYSNAEPLAVTFAAALLPRPHEAPCSPLPSLAAPIALRDLTRSVIRRRLSLKVVSDQPPCVRSLSLRPEEYSPNPARMVVIGRGAEDVDITGGDLLALIRPATVVHLGATPGLEFNIVRGQLRDSLRQRMDSLRASTSRALVREDSDMEEETEPVVEPQVEEVSEPGSPEIGDEVGTSHFEVDDEDTRLADSGSSSSHETEEAPASSSTLPEDGHAEERGEEEGRGGTETVQPRWILELERLPSSRRVTSKRRADEDTTAKELAAKKRKEERDAQRESLQSAATRFEAALQALPLPPHLLPFLRYGLGAPSLTS